MALATTPQVTATLNITSPNLLNDSLALSVTSKLYKAGTSESIDQTTGLSRTSYASVTNESLFLAADYADSKAHKIYIKNTSSSTSEFVTISIATGATSTNVEIGVLYGGDFAYLPWSGEYDIDISTSATIVVESMLLHEG
jgi:hypothetical protein